jgi:hypothetical protein
MSDISQTVLRWTTGSIVELESAVNEPVEVVVNNCVIARGRSRGGRRQLRRQDPADRQPRPADREHHGPVAGGVRP